MAHAQAAQRAAETAALQHSDARRRRVASELTGLMDQLHQVEQLADEMEWERTRSAQVRQSHGCQ